MEPADDATSGTDVGSRLFALVEHYAGMGFHRTGSAIDKSTAQWMAQQLEARGLAVRMEEVPFDRWMSTSSLSVDGNEVFHLAVPYEWEGSLQTDAVKVVDFDAGHGGNMDVLEEPVSKARADGAEAVVVATRHPQGSLVAINRDPLTSLDFPVLLVAGRDLPRLTSGSLHLQLIASTTPGTTFNVVATNQHSPADEAKPDELLLTTPLTGWFGCAGERGTGIAVLLEMVSRLEHLPLRVVATGGHELNFLAAQRWVEAHASPPKAIFHVGASVAVVEANPADGVASPHRPLAATRLALTTLGAEQAGPLVEALAPANLNLSCGAERFLGEGDTFSAIDAPLVSTTGAGLDFHTPEDTPHRATTPEALARVSEAFTAAAVALHEAASR